MRAKSFKVIMTCLSAVVLLVLSLMVLPTVSSAAAEPTLNKTSRNILVGKTYNLNVNNKISGSKYVWTSSNKKVATVDNRGIVTAKKKGEATITCTITTKDKKTYVLNCKVTVIEPASYFRIKNKVTALNLGQTYDFNRAIPATSNDKTTWTTSDPTIANPDKLGVVTALKEGTVTITGKTLSGATDSVTFRVIDADGIVTNQEQLDALLESGVGKITIKTDEKVTFNIPKGSNEKTKLVIDAPNAEVINRSKFASVEIKQIANDTYVDHAVGNNIIVTGNQAKIVVGPNAKVRIEVVGENTKLTVINDNVVEEIVLAKGTELVISGSSKEPVPLTVNAPDCKITSSVPLDLQCSAKATVTLLAGAEGTKVYAETEDAVPVIVGNVTVEVTVGAGDDASKKSVTGQPIAGGSGGSGGGYTPTPIHSITIDAILDDITAFSVTTVNKVTYDVDGLFFGLLKNAISGSGFVNTWKEITSDSYTANGKKITISGDANSLTKTVSVSGGKFDGRSFEVTLDSSGLAYTIKSASNKAVTIRKSSDGKNLTIETSKVADVLDYPTTSDILASVETLVVTYKGTKYSFSIPELNTLKDLFINANIKANEWKNIAEETKTIDGQKIKISGRAGIERKTVTFLDGQFAGKTYVVSVTASDITIKDSNNVTATFTLASNNIKFSFN